VRQELAGLEAQVALCERCYGPERRHVVRFQRPAAPPRLLILGERPPRSLLARGERLGLSNRDPGMVFLRELLQEAGIPEEGVLVGAAVMCRAAARSLEAAVPSGVCLKECSEHVRELLRLADPRLVVPLGRTALRALHRALAEHPEAAGLRFPESVGHSVRIGGRWVHPVYHVTLRARVTRPEASQRRDWREVGKLWEWLGREEDAVAPPG
jgi:uracil-DNA glycosylase